MSPPALTLWPRSSSSEAPSHRVEADSAAAAKADGYARVLAVEGYAPAAPLQPIVATQGDDVAARLVEGYAEAASQVDPRLAASLTRGSSPWFSGHDVFVQLDPRRAGLRQPPRDADLGQGPVEVPRLHCLRPGEKIRTVDAFSDRT